jgi:23S rRNA (guanosine2251-2'-O)-methyltransferase
LKKEGLFLKIRKRGPAGRSRSTEQWIYGLNPVLEAVRSGREVKAVFLSSARKDKIAEIEEEVSSRGIRINRADNLFFDSRFTKGHQGIAALVAPRKYTDVADLLGLPQETGQVPLFLVLDCIEDPSPEAVKASAGASEYVPIAMIPNIKHAMREMKESGILLVGAEATGEESIWGVDLRGPVTVVIGSEGHGLRRTVKEECDVLVSLPMRGRVNSLNASVAAGIIIFEIMRQRMSK